MNLFTVFDPSSSMSFSLNWFSSMFVLLFLPSMYWLIPSRWNFFMIYFCQLLMNEFNMVLSIRKNLMNMLMFISMFMMIFLNNFLGLFSYIFTSSSHLTFSLTLSLTMWLSFMLFGWITNTNHMFAHLIPSGTPMGLMSFMVLIETMSNFMRFGSLAVRLSANLIAGHLLMILLSSLSSGGTLISFFVVFSQIFLIMFEMGVSLIQAYVFTLLLILYSIEV
uniref:ATP synthase subunit a n=1 Tax=Platyscapa corneri TaxID=130029 RepID=A0A8A9Y8C7_9HYME|nr:ATP synthase F0 subunit 6 [Platyscapa corneri]